MLKKFLTVFIIVFTLFLTISPSFAVGDNGFSWNKKNLTVNIPKDNSYSGMMQRAFKKWQDNSYGQLTFTFTDEGDADIYVTFGDKTDGTDVGDLADYDITIRGGSIVKAQINIVPDSKKYSNDMIYTVMLHEVGHALGLADSKRNLGIMHTPVNEKQDIIPNDIIKLFRLNGWSYMNKGTYSQF